tara:strand:+ start:227 stop:1018 length:792 start_codon:yes stop_codon:yes gene_type:complete
MKFCICFYGLVDRSLKYTYDSIKNNIFDILKENNIEYDVYLHNNQIDSLNATRNNEINCKLEKNSWKVLNPKEFIIEKQKDVPANIERFDNEFKNIQDIFENNKQSYKFTTYQLYSCYKVTQLWKDKPKYDYYLYLRPDLKYLHKINIDFIKKYIGKKCILTPKWDCHDGEGLNDRIAFGNYDEMVIYGERFKYIDEFLSNVSCNYRTVKFKKHFVAELYTHWVIIKKFKLQNNHIIDNDGGVFNAQRIRANGSIPYFDIGKK